MHGKADIGDQVWHLRKNVLHLTQEEFAEEIGITPESVGNIERAVCFPSLHTLARIAEVCGVTTDYLLGINVPASK